MKFLGFNKVLCLSPHPDDVEFGMMGTVLIYTDTQFDILCLFQGGDFDKTTSKDRLEEIKNVWKNHSNINLHYTKNKFIDDLRHDAWVNYIETKFLNQNEYPNFNPDDDIIGELHSGTSVSPESQTGSPLGPFDVTSSTTKVDTRARARAISLKIANTASSQNWKLGGFRLDIQPDGRR